jgi:hypothetical protein
MLANIRLFATVIDALSSQLRAHIMKVRFADRKAQNTVFTSQNSIPEGFFVNDFQVSIHVLSGYFGLMKEKR